MNIYYYSQRKSSRRKEVEYKTFKVIKCEQKTWALNFKGFLSSHLNHLKNVCPNFGRLAEAKEKKCSGWLIWKCNVRFGNVQCQKNVVLSHLGQRYLLETWTSKNVSVAGVTLMPLGRAKSWSNGMPVMNHVSRADLHEAQALRNMMPSSTWPQNYAYRVQ